MSKLKLRPYQQEAIDIIKASIAFGSNNLVLQAPTSYGKSAVIASVAKEYEDQAVMIAVNLEPLIDQIAEFLDIAGIDYSILKAGRDRDFDSSKKIQLAMLQTLYSRIETINFKHQFYIYQQDECFTPDVEILTENGFIRFDNLKYEKVAQYNSSNKKISFIEPTRKIKYDYDGDIYKTVSKNSIDISTTPNHNFLINNQRIKAKDIKYSQHDKIKISGYATGKSEHLTRKEKLAIAFQADGSYHCSYKSNKKINPSIKKRIGFSPKKEDCSILFSFSKEKKIEQFTNDFIDLNFKELKTAISMNKNIKDRRKFIISEINEKNISKKLSDIFKLEDFSYNKAVEFIEYMVIWDGHIVNEDRYYYSSTVKENTDFIQAIAILAGYGTKVGIQRDNRKKSYKDVHRLYITKKRKDFRTNVFKNNTTIEKYSGKVYCVEVPESNIIVRRNGKPLVIGNCHKEWSTKRNSEVLKKINPEVRVSYSATPWDEKGFKLYGSEIINTHDINALTKEGYLCPIKYYVPKWAERVDLSKVKKSGNDYNMAELDKIVNTEKHLLQVVKSMNQLKAKDKKSLVFCTSIEQCDNVSKLLIKDGYDAIAYHSGNSKKENQRILESFKTGNNYIGSDEVVENATLFNKEEVSKNARPIKCLCSVAKLTTGFSDNTVELGVNLRATSVLSLWHQIVGRQCRISNYIDDLCEKYKDKIEY